MLRSKKIKHPHYEAAKPNEQHQFDLLVFKMNKASEVAFVLEAIYKKADVFKYWKVYHCDKGSKSDVTKMLEKHHVGIQRAQQNKNTHVTFAEAFKKKLV